MKKLLYLICFLLLLGLFHGCTAQTAPCQIAATTLPVYEFTSMLCEGTDLKVCQIVTQSVSCLHDYTLQASQMQQLESAKTLVISGGGLEDFLDDAISSANTIIDASEEIDLLCAEARHDHSHGHSHEQDPHIWLSPVNAKKMATNICAQLSSLYPQHQEAFNRNLKTLAAKLDALQTYGEECLSDLSSRSLITFHDGFAYFAEAFDLTILKAVEEESGSEASAKELIELIQLVCDNKIPAIFTEKNGATSSADTICRETGIKSYCLDMGMSEGSYFDAMYHNINTVKEALG